VTKKKNELDGAVHAFHPLIGTILVMLLDTNNEKNPTIWQLWIGYDLTFPIVIATLTASWFYLNLSLSTPDSSFVKQYRQKMQFSCITLTICAILLVIINFLSKISQDGLAFTDLRSYWAIYLVLHLPMSVVGTCFAFILVSLGTSVLSLCSRGKRRITSDIDDAADTIFEKHCLPLQDISASSQPQIA
jgi:hypothetical protein